MNKIYTYFKAEETRKLISQQKLTKPYENKGKREKVLRCQGDSAKNRRSGHEKTWNF